MTEEPLPGGRTDGAVRVGETVRRPERPWSATVRTLLDFLQDNGFSGASRSIGLDEQGRDVQSYLSGETVGGTEPWPAWVWSDTALAQVGRWMRDLHQLTARFEPPAGARWFASRWHRGLLIGHQDAAPYNAVWHEGRLVGFCDWGTAGPSSGAFDLAWAALFWVPLLPPDTAARLGFSAGDERRRRLHLLLDSYQLDPDRSGFRSVLLRRIDVTVSTITGLAADGDPVHRALLPQARELRRAAAEIIGLPATFWTPDR